MDRKPPPSSDELPSYMTSDFAVEEVDKPTKFQAMLERENTFGSAYYFLEDIPDDFDSVDPTFDAVAASKDMNIPEERRIDLMRSRNVNEFLWKKDNYDREQKNIEVISEMGGWESLGWGLIAAGIDPIVWGMSAIPVMRAASLLDKMGKGAQVGAIDGVATEVVFNNTQTERGADETMLNVGGTILFGSVLGGLAYRGDIREALKEANFAKHELDDAGVAFTKTEEVTYTNSAGAQEVRTGRKYADKELQAETWQQLEREEITPAEADEIIDNSALERSTVIGAGISKRFRKLTMSLDGAHSPNVELRGIFSDLAENTILINMNKEMASPGNAVDTLIDTLEAKYIVPYIQITKDSYAEYIGVKWSGFQLLKGMKARAFNEKDYISAQDWNAGLTLVKDYEGKLQAGGIYDADAVKALNETGAKLKALDDELEAELVEYELLHPENFEEGVRIEKEIYELDAGVKAFDEQEVKSLDRIFEEEGKQNIASAEIEMAGVKDFNPKAVQKYNRDEGNRKKSLKAVTARIDKASVTKRRQAKAKYLEHKKSGKGLTKKADIIRHSRESDRLKAEYKDYPTHKELGELRARKKALDEVITVPEDIALEKAFRSNLKEVRRYQTSKISKSRERSRDAYIDLEVSRTGVKEANEKLSAVWKERDEFKYAPLHGNVQGGGWYSNRMYRTREVHLDRKNFVRRGADDFELQLKEAAQAAKKGTDEYEKAYKGWQHARTGIGRQELEDVVKGVWKDITNSHTGHSAKQYGLSTRFLQERKFTVRNKALRGNPEKGDVNYLETDVLALKKAHLHAMIPQLVIKKKGYNHAERMAKADAKWEKLIDDNPKKAKKYAAEQERMAVKADALYRIVNKNYGKPQNPFSTINQLRDVMMSFNVMRALGSMPVSAIPDLGQIITRLGIANVAGNLARLVAYPSGRKMAYEAARRLTLVTERVMASRMSQLTMTGDLAPGMGMAARFMHKQANYFISATGMNFWNQTLKEFALVSFSDEIMRTAIRLQTNPEALSTVQKAKFASAGIDKGDWDYIYRMWDEHGEKEGGLHIPMVDKWEDSPMKDEFLAVLMKEVNTAVVTPGAGDLPLWMREHVGSMIGQFKSFNFAATNKILIPGVQRMSMGDPNAIAGMVTQMMLGGAVYGLKMRLQDREPATDFPTIAREALDRSGYLAIFADINAIAEKMSRGTLGVAGAYRLAGLENKDLSRYYTRPITGDIFGTSIGTFEDANKTIGAILSGEYSKGSLSAGRRMVPYQNIWYGRNGVNELQRALEESMR